MVVQWYTHREALKNKAGRRSTQGGTGGTRKWYTCALIKQAGVCFDRYGAVRNKQVLAVDQFVSVKGFMR